MRDACCDRTGSLPRLQEVAIISDMIEIVALAIGVLALLFAIWMHYFGAHLLEGDTEFKYAIGGFFAAYVLMAGLMIWLMPRLDEQADVGGLVQQVMTIGVPRTSD